MHFNIQVSYCATGHTIASTKREREGSETERERQTERGDMPTLASNAHTQEYVFVTSRNLTCIEQTQDRNSCEAIHIKSNWT